MKMYVEVDNRLIKEDKKSNNNKNSKKDSDKKDNVTIAESYGLSKNARILTE